MAENKIETNLSAIGGIHRAFAEIEQDCADVGVRIDSVDFDWLTPYTDFSGKKPGSILMNTRIQSSTPDLQEGS